MRKLLPLLLLMLCMTSSAEWVRVGGAHPLKFEQYIDPDNVKQSGPMAIMRQVWEMKNYPEPAKDSGASIKTLVEYNCQNRQLRVLKEFLFTEPWAKGKEISPPATDQAAGGWTQITPGSSGEAIIDIVCPSGEDG
jgi:hypothetical protein